MQVGVITLDGRQVGVVSLTEGDDIDTFAPDLDGYVPMGRAADNSASAPVGGSAPHHAGRNVSHGGAAHVSDRAHHHTSREGYTPRGETYSGAGGHPVRQGSAEVDQAIVDASRAHHLDPNTMRAIASIESDNNPSSNAHRSTQYKGLYQIGRDEWRRFGEGNIYSAHDNAMAAARMFEANRNQFRAHYHRDPTDAELYMMHQQGLGFYTRGAMTNIRGNPYPGMHGPQSHETFETGWGRELARRKERFSGRSAPATAGVESAGAPSHDQSGRPHYMGGVGHMEGYGPFHWGSGGVGKGSIPYGDYPITPNTVGPWGASHGAIGLNHNEIQDPLRGTRSGIEIHKNASENLDRLYTEGCFSVPPSEWPSFKRHLLGEIEKGPMYLHVHPGGASITHDQKAAPSDGKVADAAKPAAKPFDPQTDPL